MKFSFKMLQKPLCFLIILGGIGFGLLGYADEGYNTDEVNDSDPYYKAFIDSELKKIEQQIDVLNAAAINLEASKESINNVREQILSTRKAFKRVEGVLTYYFPEHINAYINGAPLDHVSPLSTSRDFERGNYYLGSIENYKTSLPLDMLEAGHYSGEKFSILAPVGLQRIDELLFSEEAFTAKEELLKLTSQLKTTFKILKQTITLRKYYFNFEIIEASRLELIRVLSRGITGFDTPGSLNAIEEASFSLFGVEEILYPLINSSNRHKVSIEKLFKDAQRFLNKHQDFETFDRLVFIKSYLNPIYKELLFLQQELDIPTSAEKFNETPSWNALSENIFSNDFLNPYYYSLLKKEEDSPELRRLGEKLFFDKTLSNNNRISCASCHVPSLAYADGEKTSKSGIVGQWLDRNSPTLINAVFSDRYFYDLRAFDLENQAEHVIDNHLEFNTSITDIVNKLNADKVYRDGFKDIYNSEFINRYQFSSALASYVISLRSFNSDFDKYIRGESSNLNDDAKRGFNLFMGKANCATCHFAPTFSGLIPPLYQENESEVLGVLQDPGTFIVDSDSGRLENGLSRDRYQIFNKSFKTTTIRNAALTAPYFHNGAYNTLEEVLEFYNLGGAQGIGLAYEVPNQTLSPDPLNLTQDEIQDVIAFINSLNDVPQEGAY
ncbi:cytochrome c peroxidase [Tamlana sp. 2_MG-2023]|uniref:cytochrome-c peroxidase n=1 Tax=unclassified Tamlana TaxID=2614803 RepID=UPI0026E45A2D|nr:MULTISPECIES: cytochrome c peroxidase [unclassified Tamlana]MDO6761679.1 cytochrome c peroxidase [Tamlana sp. 2_MG-2023]MDO6792233.1 cytochrome c peroxidase [Tamlana sp. 1_MG-2023]